MFFQGRQGGKEDRQGTEEARQGRARQEEGRAKDQGRQGCQEAHSARRRKAISIYRLLTNTVALFFVH